MGTNFFDKKKQELKAIKEKIEFEGLTQNELLLILLFRKHRYFRKGALLLLLKEIV